MTSRRIVQMLWSIAKTFLPGMASPSLLALADRYEKELTDRTFRYTFQEKGKSPFIARLEFDRSAFCHLFSIGSIVKGYTPDLDAFSGMKGWRNIQEGKITLKMLRRINPDQMQYYANEYAMIEELIETVKDPSAVRFDARKVAGSKLKSDILLYRVYGNRTIHVGISEDADGTWFARSFFVRDNDPDQYPSKYIHKMTPLKVKVKVSSKNA